MKILKFLGIHPMYNVYIYEFFYKYQGIKGFSLLGSPLQSDIYSRTFLGVGTSSNRFQSVQSRLDYLARPFITSVKSWNFFVGISKFQNMIGIKISHGSRIWLQSLPDVGGQGRRNSVQLCLVLVRPVRQTADSVFSPTESRQKKQRSGQDLDGGQNRDRQNPDRKYGHNFDTSDF